MDRAPKEELFSVVLSSNILIQYMQNDPELAILLENPQHCNIHYPRSHTSVEQLIPVLQGMLDYMEAQRIYLNVEATKQLIGFCEKNPDSVIYDITFNCERQSYGVWCVLTGNHIPDVLFGDATQ